MSTPRPVASSSVARVNKPVDNVSAFSGAGSGANVRAASFRGQSSLQSSRKPVASNAAGVSQRSNGPSKVAVSQAETKSVNKAPANQGGGRSADKATANSNGKEKRQ